MVTLAGEAYSSADADGSECLSVAGLGPLHAELEPLKASVRAQGYQVP